MEPLAESNPPAGIGAQIRPEVPPATHSSALFMSPAAESEQPG